MLDQMPPSKVWIFTQFDTGIFLYKKKLINNAQLGLTVVLKFH